MTSSKLRVAVVQFAPKLGEVQANIAKARELCRALIPRSIDLLCLPEMIFSGYMFPDAASISPYLEHPHTGPTSTFCAELARRLHCYVAAGYPERLEPESAMDGTEADPTGSTQARLVGANSAILYGPTGECVHSYRKTNLFETDLTWATPGVGFSTVSLPAPLGPVTIAICNDLNVQKPAVWETIEQGPYELAQHCVQSGTRLLVLLNAWLRPGGDSEDGESDPDPADADEEVGDGMQPDRTVLNYWATRLRPTWAHIEKARIRMGRVLRRNTGSLELLVVLCNRFGHEGGKTFAGSSAMFSMRRGSGKPLLLHAMGEREEGVRIWTANLGSS